MIDAHESPPDFPRGRSSSEPPVPYPATLFEAVHQGVPGDVDFYRRAAVGAQQILELGCGAGRVMCALESDGHSPVGIDLDRELLSIARSRTERSELIAGDFRRLEATLGSRRFDRIFCPFNGVYCLLDRESLLQTFRGVAALLTDEGLFVFDGYNAEDFHTAEEVETQAPDEVPEWVKTVEIAGTLVDVFEASRWDRSQQRIDATYHHVSRGNDAAVVARIPQRYLVRDEIEGLLAEAGLELLVLHGDFDQSAWEPDAPNFIVTAQRARVHA